MSFYDWDTNPANNTSKPGIDWSEGMLPSAVNNSARQMMADLKAFLNNPKFTGLAEFVNIKVTGSADIAAISGALGATVTTGNGVTTGGAAIELGGARTGDGIAYMDFHATAGSDWETRIIRAAGANGEWNFNNKGTGPFQFSQDNAGDFVWYTSAAEKMRLVNSGRLGLGTASPQQTLDVNGNAWTRATHYVGSAATGNIASDSNWLYLRGAGAAFQNNAGSVTFATLTASGVFQTTGGGHIVSGGYLKAESGVVYAGAANIFYMNENGGAPLINWDNNQYIVFDRVNKNWNFVNNGGNQFSLGLNGLAGTGAAGGQKGPGTGNFSVLYENNVRVPTITASSIGSPGYRRWSDGLWEIWGSTTVGANTSVVVNYPGGVSLTSWSNAVISGGRQDTGAQDNDPFVSATSTTGFTVFNPSDVTCTFWWQARGV